MGEVRVTNYPEALPQKCCVCGTGRPDRKYVDIGMSLDFYGAIYFCEFCLNEVILKVGSFVPIAEYKACQAWVAFYRDKCEILTEKVGVLNDIVGNVQSLRSVNDRIANSDNSGPAGQDPTDKQPINLSFGDVEGEGQSDSKSSGQDSSGGFEGVFSSPRET
jgi:hypothetical protein